MGDGDKTKDQLVQELVELRRRVSELEAQEEAGRKQAEEARLGAVDYLTKPLKLLELEAVLERVSRIRGLQRDRRRLRETVGGMQSLENLREGNRRLVGESAATRQVHEQIRQAVEVDCDTILITGETGVGKEVIAREIHFQAGADDSPFIAVSCPALPETLVEAELFGHVKGAFTGATADRPGYFEMADGGTLFLDEVADLTPRSQATLLRVLETRTLRRLGDEKEVRVDVRVIAASNTRLEEAVQRRAFREDLFYRLNLFTIHYPPLRERREDILPLAEHFLKLYARSKRLPVNGISAEAEALLLNYGFPGNARELRNIVERAAILCRSGRILPEHLNLPGRNGGDRSAQSVQPGEGDERARILRALKATKWNRRQAARYLGWTYSKLRYRMMKLGIG